MSDIRWIIAGKNKERYVENEENENITSIINSRYMWAETTFIHSLKNKIYMIITM